MSLSYLSDKLIPFLSDSFSPLENVLYIAVCSNTNVEKLVFQILCGLLKMLFCSAKRPGCQALVVHCLLWLCFCTSWFLLSGYLRITIKCLLCDLFFNKEILTNKGLLVSFFSLSLSSLKFWTCLMWSLLRLTSFKVLTR